MALDRKTILKWIIVTLYWMWRGFR